MKLRLSILFALFIAVVRTVSAGDVETERKSRFAVGIDNTRLVFGQYVYDNHLVAKLNVSVYSERISFQYARATVGYRTSLRNFNLSGEYFFGSAFNGNYYNTGAVVKAEASFFRRLLVDARVAPWYDSGFGYTTCFEARLGCRITDHINIRAGYTTVPEYRMSEKRLLGGFDFVTSSLYVSPYLSIGTGPKWGGKNIRVLFNFGYLF